MSESSIDQLYDEAVKYHQAGRFSEAESMYRQILQRQPDYADALHYLGVLQGQHGQVEDALKSIRRAIELNPKQSLYPYNLGIVLTKVSRWEEALVAYKQAVDLRPKFADAWHCLGDSYYALGKFSESVEAYRQVLRLKPYHTEAHNNLGMSLLSMEKFQDAIAEFREALTIRPEYPRACNNLGTALRLSGQWEEAITYYQRAANLQNDFVEAYNNLGKALFHEGRSYEGEQAFRKLIELTPNDGEAHFNLGCCLRLNYQHEQAIDSFKRAVELYPGSLSARNNLGAALNHLGRLDEAIAAYDEILKIDPNFVAVDSNRLFTMQFHPGYDSQALLREHVAWNQRHADKVKSEIIPHQNDPDPSRRLRIGYLSPDFKNHCQQFFTHPVFANHRHEEFEIYCYSDTDKPDEMTESLRKYADVWRDISSMEDIDVVKGIRMDKIDILVDLTMHMADCRRMIYARKPAPIQIAWLAYPGTTGMPTIDYRLTDPYLDPPGEHDADYTEKSIRMAHTFWCYDPRTDQPKVNHLPALSTGFITFGCMNNFAKVSDSALRLWGKVLAAVPDSRLILLVPPGNVRKRIPQLLGVDPARVEFISFQSRDKYLKTYLRIDLGLDSIPYNGHTTSLDSLWMGVPVVTLVGKTVVGRAGWSQLNNLKLTEFAAFTEDDFIRIAVDWSSNLRKLSEVRAQLRKRMEQSPVMDGSLFVRGLESIYRQVWRDWCAARKQS
jgi:protein O-GlcNAc transferase